MQLRFNFAPHRASFWSLQPLSVSGEIFLWRNVGEHPSSAAQHIHSRCQSMLKLLWWLIVAQSPAKTLLMYFSFWLHLFPALTHLSPYLPPPSSLHLPFGSACCEGACLSVCPFVCVSLTFTVGWSRLHV